MAWFLKFLCFLITNCLIAYGQSPPEKGMSMPPKHTCEQPQTSKAVVVINSDAGNVTGVLTFIQEDPNGPVVIEGKLEKCMPQGLHGFHVHQAGDLRKGCVSAGPHFNPNNYTHAGPEDQKRHVDPNNYTHAGPEDQKRHVGDLGNVKADETGTVNVSITDHVISLSGPCSIVGRALVVHLKPDDLGQGGNAESLKTGNAGSRIGCGIIGWV